MTLGYQHGATGMRLTIAPVVPDRISFPGEDPLLISPLFASQGGETRRLPALSLRQPKRF